LIYSGVHAETAYENDAVYKVCGFMNSQMSIAEKLIDTDDRQHIVSLPVKNKNNAMKVYRYSYKGITIDYIQTQDRKLISSAKFEANTFPENLRLKKNILSHLGIVDSGKIASKVSSACDTMDLELKFKGENLEGVTIYAEID
jgi:hypothetical protein